MVKDSLLLIQAMNVNYNMVFLSVVIVFLFASIYTSVGLVDAHAAKHHNKINPIKVKRGLMAQKDHQYSAVIKPDKKK